ncbi:MAG: outer membrane lipoprotein chaperone LolA [Deltaproteobacteria bacterium]|nr:outer membrane lipoprotein chaperone LolA [Deltaproteobacteria bacterium]
MIAAAGLLLLLATASAAEPTAQAVADQVQARYDATHDFTAAVRQEMTLASAGKTSSASGTVAFKKPGKMRWDLKDGTAQVIVADGRTLWFYEPDEQQVLKAPFQAAFRSSTPISFLTGVGRLRDDFTVAGLSRDGEVLRLELTPRRAEGDLGGLRLSVDPSTYDIVGAEVTDPLGNRTRLYFTDLKRNVGLADERFQFEVPAGVDVVEAPLGN